MDDKSAVSPRSSRKGRLAGTSYTELDRHVGQRLRNLRLISGHSQGSLAEFLGISFQQVQKYENGRNRLPIAALLMASEFLKFPVADFFDFQLSPYVEGRDSISATKAAVSLNMINDAGIKRSLFALITVLSKGNGERSPGIGDRESSVGPS